MLRRFINLATLVTLAASAVSASASLVGEGEVVEVRAGTLTDLVVIRGGYESGLRQGMICRVARGGSEVGELVLVELRDRYATALITRLAPREHIRSGDFAAVKVQRS